ncbi:MAG TPA: hypothetical protein VK002_07450 [Rubricoccaceae bacterium]|nr:hypothetical protein [Rubricoccaceae bacterium]
MPLIGSVLTHLILAVTLVLAAAVAGLMAYHYAVARLREKRGYAYDPETEETMPVNAVEQRAKSAEEIAQIRARIEALMEQQQIRSETQSQHLAQKLDEIRTHMNTQDRKMDGLKSELRHEIRRRDGELDELRQQLASALDAFWKSMPTLPEGGDPAAALPPAPAAPSPEPAPASSFEPDAEAPEPPHAEELHAEEPDPTPPPFEGATFATEPSGTPSSDEPAWETPPEPAAPPSPAAWSAPFEEVQLNFEEIPLDAAFDEGTPTHDEAAFEEVPSPEETPLPEEVPLPEEASSLEEASTLDEGPGEAAPVPQPPAPAPAPPSWSPALASGDGSAMPPPSAASTPAGRHEPAPAAPPATPPFTPMADAFEPPVPPVAPAPPPAATPPAPPSPPVQGDDLTVISGITPELQQQLYAAGITTLDEMARWSRADARRISGLLDVPEEVIMHQWIFEAQSVLFEQYQSMMTQGA